jgi:t-SNARE complex subunit (syntaxin)
MEELRARARKVGILLEETVIIEPKPPSKIEKLLEGYVPMRILLREIAELTKELDLARLRARQSIRKNKAAEDPFLDKVHAKAKIIKRDLTRFRAEADALPKGNVLHRVATDLHWVHTRRFSEGMNTFNLVAYAFERDILQTSKRQVRFVLPDISEEKLERYVDEGKEQELLRQTLITDSVREAVQAIEERHVDILRLEQQVHEVYELFRDLATLVDLQQESMDVIERRIRTAGEYTHKAEEELGNAEKLQKKARKCQCYLLGCCIVILVVILVPVMAVTLRNT